MSEPKPLYLKETEIREAFERWYFSKDLIPHGVMFTNLAYQGFKAGIEYMKQRIESACRFYLQYRDDPAGFLKHLGCKGDLKACINYYFKSKREWDDWLFKVTFKKALEGENDNTLEEA